MAKKCGGGVVRKKSVHPQGYNQKWNSPYQNDSELEYIQPESKHTENRSPNSQRITKTPEDHLPMVTVMM